MNEIRSVLFELCQGKQMPHGHRILNKCITQHLSGLGSLFQHLGGSLSDVTEANVAPPDQRTMLNFWGP